MSEAIIGLAGVVIGALIGIFTMYMQNKNNVDMFILQKRIDAYLPVVEKYFTSTHITASDFTTDTAKKVIDEFQDISPEILLYGSVGVRDQVEIVKDKVLKLRFDASNNEASGIDDIMASITEFSKLIDIMRSELKIK